MRTDAQKSHGLYDKEPYLCPGHLTILDPKFKYFNVAEYALTISQSKNCSSLVPGHWCRWLYSSLVILHYVFDSAHIIACVRRHYKEFINTQHHSMSGPQLKSIINIQISHLFCWSSCCTILHLQCSFASKSSRLFGASSRFIMEGKIQRMLYSGLT